MAHQKHIFHPIQAASKAMYSIFTHKHMHLKVCASKNTLIYIEIHVFTTRTKKYLQERFECIGMLSPYHVLYLPVLYKLSLPRHARTIALRVLL